MTRCLGFEHLVDDWKRFAAAGFPATEVRQCFAETRMARDAREPYSSYRDAHSTRNLAHKDQDFELIGICWGRVDLAYHSFRGEPVERARG